MIYLIGRITYIAQNYVYLESNFVGRKVFIKQNEKVALNRVVKMYTTEIVVETSKGQSFKQIYGFILFSDFILFNKLITLPSIGPKTALNVLDNDIELVTKCIIEKDAITLGSLKGITQKVAKIIISNLSELFDDKKGQTETKNIANLSNEEEEKYIQIIDSLKSLGYNKKEIEYGINKLDLDENKEFIVEDVLAEIIKNISNHKIS